MSFSGALLRTARRGSDLSLAACVALIVAAMVVPLPPWALDTGLALNLAVSAGLLVAALYARDALSVTSFPTLLLVSTLFRLSLNVSSTRLALAEGHAGEIIQAFGEFVVRGDYWVGAAVFCILAIVQLVVVAKGAERVAEVSARFTLDAMPGKQMSIDADLRAGIIDARQAQRRRHVLEREAQMFGAMDGAMKFVKGDAIAGLIIVAVNLCVGTAVGVLQHDQGPGDALATYALIAIGDGLVSQLPSLCIALAAGLLVTRVTGEDGPGSLGTDIAHQFLAQPRVFGVVAALCVSLACVPGMPAVVFLSLALVLAAAAVWLGSVPAVARGEAASAVEEGRAPVPTEGASLHTPGVAPLSLELGEALSGLVEAQGGDWVRGELERVRERLYRAVGVQAPGIQVQTRVPTLPAGGYRLLLDEVPLARAELDPRSLYVRGSLDDLRALGLVGAPVDEAWRGEGLTQVDPAQRERLEALQLSFLTPLQVIAERVERLLQRNAARLVGLQETRRLVDALEPQAPVLVQEALQKVPLPLLTDVLKQLLAEEVSIRDLRSILEALVSPGTEGDAEALVERCRQGLQRYLSHKYAPEGPLYAYLVDPSVEEVLRTPRGQALALDPAQVVRILEGVRQIASEGGAIVLTAHDTRRALRKLCEGSAPELAVLTYRELDPTLPIRPLGRLTASA